MRINFSKAVSASVVIALASAMGNAGCAANSDPNDSVPPIREEPARASLELTSQTSYEAGVEPDARAEARTVEPEVLPTPYAAVDGEGAGEQLQLNFPPAAKAGVRRSTYWLTGAEDVEIDVQVAIGPGPWVPPIALTGVVVVDGLQQPFHLDDGETTMQFQRRILRLGEVHHFKLKLSGKSLRPGTHKAAVLLWKATGAPFPMVGFEIVKDRPQWMSASRSPGFRLRPAATASPSLLRSGRPPYEILHGRHTPVRPDERGRIPLRIRVARLDRAPWDEHYTLVAFLDGQQIAIGALGRRPHLQLAAGRLAEAEGDVTLPPIPRDDSAHALVVIALAEDSGPPEQPEAAVGRIEVPPLWIGGTSFTGGKSDTTMHARDNKP